MVSNKLCHSVYTKQEIVRVLERGTRLQQDQLQRHVESGCPHCEPIVDEVLIHEKSPPRWLKHLVRLQLATEYGLGKYALPIS